MAPGGGDEAVTEAKQSKAESECGKTTLTSQQRQQPIQPPPPRRRRRRHCIRRRGSSIDDTLSNNRKRKVRRASASATPAGKMIQDPFLLSRSYTRTLAVPLWPTSSNGFYTCRCTPPVCCHQRGASRASPAPFWGLYSSVGLIAGVCAYSVIDDCADQVLSVAFPLHPKLVIANLWCLVFWSLSSCH